MTAKFVNRQAMEELKVKLPLFGGVQKTWDQSIVSRRKRGK